MAQLSKSDRTRAFLRFHTGGVHSYRNCCFLKVVHATVAGSVDTPENDFSVVRTLILNKTMYVLTKYIWPGSKVRGL